MVSMIVLTYGAINMALINLLTEWKSKSILARGR